MGADVIPLRGPRPVVLSQDETAVRTHAVAEITCPWCEAQPGERCTRTDALGERHVTRLLHQTRVTAARRDLEGTR